MNGTLANWLAHALLALALQAATWLVCGSVISGAVLATTYFFAKEVGEFSVKHWDAPGRPLADLNLWHPRRTRDDRLDVFVPAAAVWLVCGIARFII